MMFKSPAEDLVFRDVTLCHTFQSETVQESQNMWSWEQRFYDNSHPKRLQCSATMLWEPPISQHIIYSCHIQKNTNSISVCVSNTRQLPCESSVTLSSRPMHHTTFRQNPQHSSVKDMKLCHWVHTSQCSKGMCYHYPQGFSGSSFKMNAVHSFRTSSNAHPVTKHHMPKEWNSQKIATFFGP